jgi:curved DNA-binding protein CbpA
MTGRRTVDPYVVLGVSREATPLQIARAHRRLAKRHHPDLNPGEDAERMRRINEAWQILSVPARRAAYDEARVRAGGGGHWSASRPIIRPSTPSTTRTWATWRATAAETRAAPRTVRQPGEVPVPATRRPGPFVPEPVTFRDSGWAALVAAAVILLLLATAIVAGKLV